MEDFYKILLLNILSLGGVGVLCYFVIQKAIALTFSKELEKYKGEILLINELEKFKFSALHNKRAEVIATIYGMVIKLKNELELHASAYQDKVLNNNHWGEEASGTLGKLEKYFYEHEIYFENKTAEKIRKLLLLCDDLTFNSVLEYYEKKEVFKKVHREFPELMFEIKKEFQGIFGIQ